MKDKAREEKDKIQKARKKVKNGEPKEDEKTKYKIPEYDRHLDNYKRTIEN
jgi:hypothetical protein